MQTVALPQSEPVSSRVAPLAVLPVFFDLRGKTALVVGGGEPATWKIELLAAAGASVAVFAPPEERCDELEELARRTDLAGSIELIARPWRAEDMAGAAIAIADLEDDNEAMRFVAAARTQGVPYNVIDRPEFCQFQFGAIVNRSPVVVGISTAGAAPILGQAIRRRIEILLPQTLARWAQFAQDIRGRITQAFAHARRRRIWERLADRAFGGTLPPDDPMDLVLDAEIPAGRVTLVGAGPGEAELLTVKAIRALQSADVILFDDLVSAEVLELARREAKRLLVGKRAARPSCAQEDINETMLKLARQGKHVVRLKSGDPMVFGRAGEEISMLESHGIPVTVVPGITAGIALASRLGVSLTHRDYAQSVRFVTGHARSGELPTTLDWPSLAEPRTTTIYYMARRTLPDIVSHLTANGMPADTPAVLASDLGRSTETIWRGPLAEVLDASKTLNPTAPTLFATGAALAASAGQAIPNPGLSIGRAHAGRDAH